MATAQGPYLKLCIGRYPQLVPPSRWLSKSLEVGHDRWASRNSNAADTIAFFYLFIVKPIVSPSLTWRYSAILVHGLWRINKIAQPILLCQELL